MKHTSGPIFSGTNLDDLCDYRPGLEAAKEHQVVHPYIEAGIDKAGVRAIARSLGLDELANLAASPCLASRIETGITIKSDDLVFVDRVESSVRAYLPEAVDVRCRMRSQGVEIELNGAQSKAMETGRLLEHLHKTFPELMGQAIQILPYRRGSGFIHVA